MLIFIVHNFHNNPTFCMSLIDFPVFFDFLLFCSEFSSISHSYQMAPSVCQTSPKLPPHNNTQSGVHSGGGGGCGGGGSGAMNGQKGVSSITQLSNCGGSSINGSMASYKMSTTSDTSWSQTQYSKVRVFLNI